MYYNLEKKKEIINGKPDNMDVEEYCVKVGIGKSSYYKWLKLFDESNNESSFIDLSSIQDKESIIDIEVNGITIHIHESFDSKHLSNVIKTLKLL